ncbi:LacI family transcriptional regulator (plasmid) [Fulvitalea axinellae]|uniref:LacI family transcriptional regulator n=1 Tax=Fulvitalea axinellae TaxID=1182444 RepID=A0AAU9DGH1_9BACT|nr:LacI family transcriptional regulator [Fulvitalea axinellae]
MRRKKRQVTIKDLARKLDVSVSTVSRALRGAEDINKETKKAVLALAEELDYQPNTIAMSLVNKKTNTIGVIVPELAMHFFASAIGGIQDYAARKGYNVMICQSNENYETEMANTETLVKSRVDGLIVSCSRQTSDYSHFERLLGKGHPLVFFDRIPGKPLPASSVIVDDYQGAFNAVTHLLDSGCKRVAHLSGPDYMLISRQREKGYRDALEAKGIPFDESLVKRCDLLRNDAYDKTLEFLSEDNIDGIFAITDPVAMQAIRALKAEGKSIPEDVSVVGFTDEPVNDMLTPSLTSVRQPAYELGENAAKLLLEQIEAYHSEEAEEPPVRTALVKTTLMERGSTKTLETVS